MLLLTYFKKDRFQYIDKRFLSKDKLSIKFNGNLRDYQEKAVKELLKQEIGTLQATTGSGKTIMAIKAICERKQPTLFLVHTLDLANQFIERVAQFTDYKKDDIGVIGNGKYIIKPITVATLQTLVKLSDDKIKEINRYFGQVFIDETHICPANTYAAAVNKLSMKYRHGLTATPFRDDGLTDVIFFISGKIFYKVSPEDAGDHLIMPSVEYVETDYNFPIIDSSEHAIMITDLSIDAERNKLIVKTYDRIGNEKQSVFLSHRTEQLDRLKEDIPHAEILTSATKKKDRQRIINDLNSRKLKAVLTTYGLFATGIDIPSLEVLYLCTPMKAERLLVQTVGRLKRKGLSKNKQALVIDFVDKNIDMLKRQYYARKRTWKKIDNQEI